LNINGAEVTLGSTAVMSLVDDQDGNTAFEITMADGEAVINDELVVPEGFWAQLPLDNETPLDDGYLLMSDGDVFCRETPQEARDNFMAIIDSIPTDSLNYTVEEIETDPRGCHTTEMDTEDEEEATED
ncbi:MAG: hypothetical protein AAF125_06970, partial [Chloroflexota bacterium]